MASLVSLQALLDAAIQAVIQALALQAGINPAMPRSQTLRLGRKASEISYIYRLAPQQAHPLAPWPESFLQAWPQGAPHLSIALGQPWEWLRQTIPYQTICESLPSGQLLFYPQAAVLGGWLGMLADPQSPALPQSRVIAAPSSPPPFPAFHTPLADRLQLSPLALLHYTRQRCQQLAASSHPSSDAPFLLPPKTWPDLAPTTPSGQQVLRALVKLVDHLGNEDLSLRDNATAPNSQVRSQGFVNGYHLCEAVDLWLKEVRIPVTTDATTALLQGVERALDRLLQDWLPDPIPSPG